MGRALLMGDRDVRRCRLSGIVGAKAIAAFHSPVALVETLRFIVSVPLASKNLKSASLDVGANPT
jgi:hypothetical protein